MMNSNNALGFAVKSKVSGLDMLRQDRQAVTGMFQIDREDSGNDGFELLAKRLANSASLVFAAIKKDFKGSQKPLVIDGIQVKQLREGRFEDIAWTKEAKNTMLEGINERINRGEETIEPFAWVDKTKKGYDFSEGKQLSSKFVSFKKALDNRNEKEKELYKVLDIEFNEQNGYPTLKRLSNSKFLVESEKNKGRMFSDFLMAMEHFVSLGGKIETKKGE